MKHTSRNICVQINQSINFNKEMSRKKDVTLEINPEKINALLASYFEGIYNELRNELREETNYKHLLRIGEKQYFDAPTESSIEIESKKSRLCFAKISLLAAEVDNDIDAIIKKKLQGDFFNKFKEEVLKAILELYSKQKNASENGECPSSVSKSEVEQKKSRDKAVLEKIKDISKYCAQNINEITKQASELPDGESELCGVKEKRKTRSKKKILALNDGSSIDLGNLSFESISSVHTSDLSSFDDEIVLSSDEEYGIKRKSMVLKTAQEKVEEFKAKRLKNSKDSKEVRSAQSDLQTENSQTESSNVSQKSQRVRKPNSKYASSDAALLPLKKKSTEKIAASCPFPATSSNIPRKRGRPRKHVT